MKIYKNPDTNYIVFNVHCNIKIRYKLHTAITYSTTASVIQGVYVSACACSVHGDVHIVQYWVVVVSSGGRQHKGQSSRGLSLPGSFESSGCHDPRGRPPPPRSELCGYGLSAASSRPLLVEQPIRPAC